jgi:hypothetical protein
MYKKIELAVIRKEKSEKKAVNGGNVRNIS